MERSLLCVLGLMYALHGGATIYQWRDGAGVMQFSDRRPPDQMQVIEHPDMAPDPEPPAAVRSRPKPAVTAARHPSKRTAGSAADQARRKHAQQCASQQRRIEKVRSQLRAGYSAQRGIKLNARLRAARDVFYSKCR